MSDDDPEGDGDPPEGSADPSEGSADQPDGTADLPSDGPGSGGESDGPTTTGDGDGPTTTGDGTDPEATPDSSQSSDGATIDRGEGTSGHEGSDSGEGPAGERSTPSASGSSWVAPPPAPRSYLRSVRDRFVESRTFQAVVGITLVSLLARLLYLGERTAHWDEGRVAYWVLRYAESGVFEYRAIVHGPFFFQVDRWLFTLFGPSDFVARLPVAVLGGLLPMAAWLLRERLKPAEVVTLAVVFAGNPLLLYYSRFMRNDVLVAGFMLFAIALFVRALDTRGTGYLYAGTASMALGFTAKENALVYTVCWLGALGLLLDHRLFRADDRPAGDRTAADGAGYGGGIDDAGQGRGIDDAGHGRRPASPGRNVDDAWIPRLDRYLDDALDAVRYWWLPVGVALVEFLVVIVFFFAPRGGGYGGDGVGLWMAFTDPAMFPAVIEEALVGSWQELYGTWLGSEKRIDLYPGRLENFLGTMRATAGAVAIFSLVGFVADRWSAEGPRDVVALAFYWGIVSVIGYPYATDIWAPWIAVHAVVPLAVPAAVGLALVYGWGRDAARDGNGVIATAAVALLALMVVSAGVTAVDVAYLGSDTHERALAHATAGTNDHNQKVLQWAQPGNGLKDTMGEVGKIARSNEGVDVLYVGSTNPGTGQNHFYVPDRRCDDQPPVHQPDPPCNVGADLDWHSRLPLPWYMARHDAVVTSTDPDAGAEALENPPPVVVAYAWDRQEVAAALPARYEANEHRFKLWSENVVVFVDRSAVPG